MWQIELMILFLFTIVASLILFGAKYLDQSRYSPYEITGKSECINGNQALFKKCSGLTIPELGRPCIYNKIVGYRNVIENQNCITSVINRDAIITTETNELGITTNYNCPHGNCIIKTKTGERILLGGLTFPSFKNIDLKTRRFSIKALNGKYFIDDEELSINQIITRDRNFSEFTPFETQKGTLKCPQRSLLFTKLCPVDVLMQGEIKIPGQCFPPGTCNDECPMDCINLPDTLNGYVLGQNDNLYGGVSKIPILINKNITSLCGIIDTWTSSGALFYPARDKAFVILKDYTSGWWAGINQELTIESQGISFNIDDFEILNIISGHYTRDSRCMGL